MTIAIVGGGIGGLSLALALHQRGLACQVFESVAEVKELGVGITLLPHAVRELAALGVLPQLEAIGIENRESVFFNRFGQFIYKEARGRHAGYDWPELGVPRGKLHLILYAAVLARMGPEAVRTDHRCVGVEQSNSGATVHFVQSSTGAERSSFDADVVIACDGVNSAVRRLFYPDEKVAFAGINTWRGVTRHKPILTGSSYLRIGSIETGKMVIYPIVDPVDAHGNQLINWVAEVQQDLQAMNDWNQPGQLADLLPIFKDWRFPWLDAAELIATSDKVLEYPMVDKDPVAQWTFGRVTLLGDAAHPMYPRGSNGSAQALVDGRVLADLLQGHTQKGQDLRAALLAYEAIRLPATAKIVLTNRSVPPDFIIMKADELSGGKPFANIDDLISQDELRAISEHYKQVAGFSLESQKA